jgi:hypothetical protein
VASTTSLTLEDAATETLAGAGYTLSGQLDVEDGQMWNLLLELCRKDLRIDTRMNLTNEELENFNRAVRAAKSAEGQRHRTRRVAGSPRSVEYPTRTAEAD